MALLSRELQWAGRCLEVSRESCFDRRRRGASLGVLSSLRGGAGTFLLDASRGGKFEGKKRPSRRVGVCYASQKTLYETLGVSPAATEKEIKRAYRGLALKFHPDVNKQPGAQEKFLEIKNAYQTLVDSKSRSKYDASSRTRSDDWDPFQWGTSSGLGRKSTQEEFYGFDEFLKDVQSDLKKRSSSKSAEPKSLWEELADIGEEFVEFLEKELNISGDDGERENTSFTRSSRSRNQDTRKQSAKSESKSSGTKTTPGREEPTNNRAKTPENDIDEIEDILAKLKKEMGR